MFIINYSFYIKNNIQLFKLINVQNKKKRKKKMIPKGIKSQEHKMKKINLLNVGKGNINLKKLSRIK